MSVLGPDGTRHAPGSLRALEHQSIRDFVYLAASKGYLSGRVLDYGCGKQPYRVIVEAGGGHYEGYDHPEYPASVVTEPIGEDLLFDANAWDTILVTQVIQYQLHPFEFLGWIREHLFTDGHLVMTYPTNWPEVERADIQRFTMRGMEQLLLQVGFEAILEHECRGIGAVSLSGDEFAVGYGVIARRG